MRSAQSLPDLAPALEISVHRGDLAALAADWDALFDPAHPGAVFRSWAWISAWWNSFSIGREPFVLLAREHGATVGILPLCSERSALGGRRLVFLGEGIVGSDYLGIVCRAGDEPRLADAFAHALARESFDELSLDGILRGDPLLPALEGVMPASRADVEPRYRCPHITLAGGFEAYLKSLPDGTGQQWKRRLRWLEKRPGFDLERITDPAALVVGLDALFELHHKRWAVEGGSDAIDSPAVEAFHRSAARTLAERGLAQLYILHAEGAARAALYGWRHGDRFVFYQAGYDPEWRQRSVGTVLLGHIVKDCFAASLGEFDFLRGTESYKLKWANGWRETVRFRARDASLRALLHDAGRSAYWRLREAGKRALPPSTLEWARRARKAVTR
ncbi:MAG TPA: GNAT family N-acetyltransferase [Polyangia bacterium]|nr:GNAT family N-acetyltransferase [Polyangia bacterium]